MTARPRVSYISMYVNYAQITEVSTLAKLLIAAKREQMDTEVTLLTIILRNLPYPFISIKTTLNIQINNYQTMIWVSSSHAVPQILTALRIIMLST